MEEEFLVDCIGGDGFGLLEYCVFIELFFYYFVGDFRGEDIGGII